MGSFDQLIDHVHALEKKDSSTDNPRIAAGMSVTEWERARKKRRRAEWEARLKRRDHRTAEQRRESLALMNENRVRLGLPPIAITGETS